MKLECLNFLSITLLPLSGHIAVLRLRFKHNLFCLCFTAIANPVHIRLHLRWRPHLCSLPFCTTV